MKIALSLFFQSSSGFLISAKSILDISSRKAKYTRIKDTIARMEEAFNGLTEWAEKNKLMFHSVLHRTSFDRLSLCK